MHFTKQEALWVSEEVDVITGGCSSTPWAAIDLTIRQDDVCPGDLFFASASDDLACVFDQGAAAAVVPTLMAVPEDIEKTYPILRVTNVFESLRSLARAARFRTHSLVIAVQGYEQRQAFSRALGAVADYYMGGRHLSSSMAAMPEACDFSVFSMAPSLQPDVVVIDKPAQLREPGLFDAMPANGIVLLNTSDEAYMPVMAMARAAGLKNILCYGPEASEAWVEDRLVAQNGVQFGLNILGERICAQANGLSNPAMPMQMHSPNMLLAAMMVVKLSDIKLAACASYMVESYMGPLDMVEMESAVHGAQQKNLALFRPGHEMGSFVDEAIFKVKSVIDTGIGRKALVLDQGAPDARVMDFTLPGRIAGLDLMCASKKISIFKNARKAVEGFLKGRSLQSIVPSVLTPGDYVVFKSSADATRSVFSEALRSH